ncbi:hypothetical protein [Streptomyces lavendofoliae]|uniref:hypothetical protein n=1 Tax=Streptomyces lavendofoliae TaxID=67314 RepID=UPI00300E752F
MRRTLLSEPGTLRTAIECFHQILADPRVAAATHEHLVREQRAAGIHHDGRPLTALLRPRLISPADHAHACSTAALLSNALRRLAGHAMGEGEQSHLVRSVLAPSPVESELAAMAPPYEGSLHARLDGFLTDGRLSFVEHNAHPPGGLMTQDVLADIYAGTPAMQEFARAYSVRSTWAGRQVSDSLLHSWETSGAPGGEPRVAIVDCTSSVAEWEFGLLRNRLTRAGVTAMVCSTDALEYEPGRGLYARVDSGGRSLVTVVYRRAVLNDLLAAHGDALLRHPLVRAWADGACVVVNSFTSHMAHKKSVLALLSDPSTAHLLSPQEAEAARAHIPWTRLLRPGTTTWHDREVDLLTLVREQREHLVIKPNDDYGGHAVVCGWQRSTAQWEEDLQGALRTAHVVQERVSLPLAPYPQRKDGQLRIDNWQESTDPYLFGTDAFGCISRLSAAEGLGNVSAGGALVPSFQITGGPPVPTPRTS